MKYVRVGASGLKVSEFCLGTMTFGRSVDEDRAKDLVDVAFDAGVTFFDTANTYSAGASETLLGKALKGRRKGVVIATKFANPMGPGPNDSGVSRASVLEAVEDSLRRLQTDYIDIYYIHHVDTDTPMEETLRTLEDLVRSGKVRYIGCSNYQAWRLSESLHISDTHDWSRFIIYQPQYSLVVRDIEQELVPLCQYHGLGICCWAPLGSGFLTGKYQPGQREVPGTRSAEHWAFFSRFFHREADAILAELLKVAEELGRSPAQVALRWVLEKPFVTAPIVGARTAEQLRDNLRCTGWTMAPEHLARLDQVSYLPPRYPESMEAGWSARRADALKMPSLD